MQIVPMRDLKDTVQIEKKCQNGPVFVTKNGYGKLVVMNMEYYESKIAKIAEADFINEGIVDFANEKINDGKEVMKKLKDKYGIQ
ncbi:MAG: type II toxin-antitoxin system Phd/YefM family antitoxin [Lachnoanaerobaculum sp.]|jgi:prevent-host-death family protein|uniref:type II toxin-antitoxin system Phd/YefM family antitoxin n=1 Tax=Lachnoanaerobaculum sp. TaxID=2049030 RepID=UPI0025C6DC9D|nr:type II toxin-antitoxin system Phd/YefM family antitoxin [Lachnoanaerobaculum sp.]MBS5880926.1 type II toxin-antitoxin system Phd/YefM family antitoxin [Lachnoanaerobaculum sp.]MDU6629458.1 type II toxin-antitoxin system Phd/YefM family antitoxin [Lachnoanaerobaculum sp.]